MPRPLRLLGLLALASFGPTLPLRAQLDLPERIVQRPPPAGADVKPLPRGDLARDLDPRVGNPGDRSLDLPKALSPRRSEPPSEPPPAAPAAASGAAPSPAPGPLASANAATFVLEEVAKLREVTHAMVDHAVQSLLRMGDVGRAAATGALASDHAPTLMVAAKVLLQTGVAADCELVQDRLRTRLPAAACAPLVDALAALDPVHASPTFFAELLAHRQSPVRAAAQRRLAREGVDLPPSVLARPLAAKESDARARAVMLLSGLRDRSAVGMLLERLGDASPEVARRAVEALAAREDAELGPELLRRAFEGRWVLRPQAYALLALCEREDLRLEPLLQPAHATRLLEGMTSNDPFVSGTCAAALAGIGFRSTDAAATDWLELDVPHRLVRAVAAEDFSSDFSSLMPTAQRRLSLVTGQAFGSDGPRWIEWWTAHAPTFRAARAVLAAPLELAGTLEVRVVSNAGAPEAFALLGPERAAQTTLTADLVGETYYLSDAQARALLETLREGEVFGAERLPGNRGSSLEPGRAMTVTVDGRSKAFRFAGESAEPWFTAALEAARSLRARNLWQRLRDPKVHASQLDLWRAEAAWWDAETDESERDRRLWTMGLGRIASLPASERDATLSELARLASERGAVRGEDFGPLLELVRAERFANERVRTLVGLAIEAGRRAEAAASAAAPAGAPAEDPGAAEGSAPDAPLAEPYVKALVDVLVERFDSTAAREISTVLLAAGREGLRARTVDPRPLVRSVVAATLARLPDRGPDDVQALLELLRDPSPSVEASAVLAVGEAKLEAARDEVVSRARRGTDEVRANALVALGLLGGEGALSTLLGALGDERDPLAPPAAARGIALLRDPSTVPVLVSVLTRGADDPCYGPARDGLIELGSAAWDELLRVVRSPAGKARREAALVLSEQLVPEVASVLMTQLTEEPDDARIAEELAILSCVDLRGESKPSVAWWTWWEYVVHDDAQAWLVGAVGRTRADVPTAEQVRDGDAAGLALLGELIQSEESYLAERARRELARLAGRAVGALPSAGRERQAWFQALRETIEARR